MPVNTLLDRVSSSQQSLDGTVAYAKYFMPLLQGDIVVRHADCLYIQQLQH